LVSILPWQYTRPGKHTKNYGKSPFLMGKLWKDPPCLMGKLWKITIFNGKTMERSTILMGKLWKNTIL